MRFCGLMSGWVPDFKQASMRVPATERDFLAGQPAISRLLRGGR